MSELRGHEVSVFQSCGIRASITDYLPGMHLARHTHRIPYLSVVLSGSYRESVNAHLIECTPLDVRLHPADEEHTDHFGAAGGRCLNLELLDTAWHACLSRRDWHGAPLRLPAAGWLVLSAAAVTRRASVADGAIVVESAVAELLSACAQHRRRTRLLMQHAAIRNVVDRLESALPGSTPSLRDLAHAVQLHPTHLARAFRRRMGCTIGEYAREARLLLAERMLVDSEVAITQVAVRAGYADHAHLTRTLRRHRGVSPSGYRHAARVARMR